MKLIFLTNLLTPHQLPLAKAFSQNPELDFLLIECVNIKREALPIGWQQNGSFDFVVSYEKLMANLDYYINQITESDVVITGSAPDFLIKKRLKLKKLTFRYSERVYKKPCPWYELPLRAVKYFWKHGRHKNLYLLCASAYTAGDYAKTGTFLNKAFKWGYFPEVKYYEDIDALIEKKEKNALLWAGRIIDWKHPEAAVEVAKRLKEDGFDFNLNIIGTGEMEDEIKKLIDGYGLNENVHLLGAMKPEEVREYMEKSQIYLFTSDRGEGWGAVLNEAMNSGCAVIASHAIGSVPFLVDNGKNGFIYKDGYVEDLYNKAKLLLENTEIREKISKEAYKTIAEQWNAQNASCRMVELAKKLEVNPSNYNVFGDGVCSCSELLEDDWYKNVFKGF